MENNLIDVNEKEQFSGYAGFWLRLIAALFDGILLSVVNYFTVRPILILFGIYPPNSNVTEIEMLNFIEQNPKASMTDFFEFAFGIPISHFLITIIASTIFQWLYFAIMESSVHQATLGKKIFNLKVTDINGSRISFGRATARHFSKLISGFIFLIGYIMAGFTERKQALHDIIAGCLVYRK